MVDLSPRAAEARLDEAMELMHFGFRGIVEEPDRELAKLGFSRMHHRVLYFVGRNPAVAIGALQRLLGVSKQALNRPLRELVDGGFVERRDAPGNRRTKHLSLTRKGATLEARVSGAQRRQFAIVFRAAGRAAEAGWRRVMRELAGRPIPARPDDE